MREFSLLDEAIEWAEDQVIFRYGGFVAAATGAHLKEQALLAGLTDQLADLTKLGTARSFRPATHRLGRRAGVVAVFPAKRHGQRQAAQRRTAREPRRGHGIR